MTLENDSPNNFIKNASEIKQEIDSIIKAFQLNKTLEIENSRHQTYLAGKVHALRWALKEDLPNRGLTK